MFIIFFDLFYTYQNSFYYFNLSYFIPSMKEIKYYQPRSQLKPLTPHSTQNRIKLSRNVLKRRAYVAGSNENVRLFDNLLWNYGALCSWHKLATGSRFYYVLPILF